MKRRRLRSSACMIVCLLAWAAQQLIAQQSTQRTADLHGRVELPHLDKPNRHVAFVVWLTPAGNAPQPAPRPPGRFTLVQKNRMFSPHLLVIPVGSTVSFPNQDPFFHNVFSLFNGRRFDLGLYEAGSTKEVVFSREGVSYIFCNIHPDMSAVVISLSTPFFAIGDNSGEFTIHDAPPGDYELHAWVEGMPQPVAESITRRVHLSADGPNNEVIDASHAASQSKDHLNKFGKPYDRDVKPY